MSVFLVSYMVLKQRINIYESSHRIHMNDILYRKNGRVRIMRKLMIGIFLIFGVISFSNCALNADKLVKTVIKQKLTVSSKDNLKYFEPEVNGKEYKYEIFEDHETHTVNRAYIVLDMKTGIAYKENIADDKLEKIYQNKNLRCK